MHTMTVVIVLAIPAGCLLGCMLGALAEITLHQRENSNG